jgi:hypothetical protein
MNITVSVYAERNMCANKVYFIRYSNGNWSAMDKTGTSLALSNFSDNAAEFYIDLCNCDNKPDAIEIIRKHGRYLRKDSIK